MRRNNENDLTIVFNILFGLYVLPINVLSISLIFLILFVTFSVKYIREVSPYFRKTSALNELGWGNQEAQRDAARANWTETKTIPLRLCYLCRNLCMSDPEKRTLELHSPDGKSTCILRFPDPATASDWFNAIHSNVMLMMSQCIVEANQIMMSAPNSREVKHIGWLSEQVLVLVVMYLVISISTGMF